MKFAKFKKDDKVWVLIEPHGGYGSFEFSFDKKKVFNFFRDYPDKLTKEEKAIFDNDFPYWADFFAKE